MYPLLAKALAVAGLAAMTLPGAPQRPATPARPVYPGPPIRIIHRVTPRFTVQRGDTLASLARRYYGTEAAWPALWWVNRDQIRNPAMIHIGDTLVLSPWHPVKGWLTRAALAAIPKPPPVRMAPAAAAPAPVSAAPQQAAPYSGGAYSYAALEALWVSAGGPASAEAQAAQIALCESGGNPSAYNPSGATGLWQILGQVVPGNLDDPAVNAANAVAKFNASGGTFAQWVCQ